MTCSKVYILYIYIYKTPGLFDLDTDAPAFPAIHSLQGSHSQHPRVLQSVPSGTNKATFVFVDVLVGVPVNFLNTLPIIICILLIPYLLEPPSLKSFTTILIRSFAAPPHFHLVDLGNTTPTSPSTSWRMRPPPPCG